MNLRRQGIFGKVFLYTLLLLFLTITITAVVFAGQFLDFYKSSQVRLLHVAFQPLQQEIRGENIEEIIKSADEFHKKNESFFFKIQTEGGDVIYEAGEAVPETLTQGQAHARIALPQGLQLQSSLTLADDSTYDELIQKTLIAVTLMLIAGTAGALLFARGITGPIKKLASDTRKMAGLEPVDIPDQRHDEVGQLTNDVHAMYEKLKSTISALEVQIQRVKRMEEDQRYFFSAASHELKTPITATSALLEGMIANIGDYSNHPKYLRECLSMMGAQNKIVSEILEVVNLSNDKTEPRYEEVELSPFINSLLAEYIPLAKKKEQTILVDIPETVCCRADRLMLRRVVSNVIMNAIQNSPKSGEIRVWTEPEGDGTIRLCILNTDAHIDDDLQSKLFQPFYRKDKARSRSEERSGLGLTIVKKMLDSMEIPFSLENQNEDVVFWIDLPFYRKTTD